jgi:glycosyltransferase involved in cell wall biosynthesis
MNGTIHHRFWYNFLHDGKKVDMNNFSVIIPVYNEADILQDTLSELTSKLEQRFGHGWELILVENGSRDTSYDLCQWWAKNVSNVRAFHLPCPSYGQALQLGILKARQPIVVIFNVDFWDLDFLERALELCEQCDVVCGSKTLIASQDQRPLWRRLVTYLFNAALRLSLNFSGTDTHGIKVFRREPFVPLARKVRAERELFDTELLLRASRQGYILAELPVTVIEKRPSRYNNWRRARNTLHDLAKIFIFRYGTSPR